MERAMMLTYPPSMSPGYYSPATSVSPGYYPVMDMQEQDQSPRQSPPAAGGGSPTSAGAAPPSPTRKAKHRSCELCRALKIACVLSDVPGTCAKCLKHGKTCVVTERAPRTVKARKTSKTRVAEVERKLDGLVALLTAETSKLTTGRVAAETGVNFTTPAPKPFSPERRLSQQQQSPLSRHNSVHSGPPSCPNDPSVSASECSPSTNITSPDTSSSGVIEDIDVIGRGIVSIAESRIMLEAFGDYQRRFPFVLIGPNHTVENLRAEKPLLLLSILTTVSYQDRPLQVRLEAILRKAIGEKIFMKVERNIGLLQALIVYIGCEFSHAAFEATQVDADVTVSQVYHYHFKPHMQNLTQLLNAAIAMIMDLGYDRRPQRTAAQQMAIHVAKQPMEGCEKTDTEKTQDHMFWSQCARRAFLGVWWMSSTLSIAFRRSNLLQNHRAYVDKCSRSLFENPGCPLDLLLDRLIRAQMIQEDIFITFGYCDDEGAARLSDLQLQMNLRSFDGQIETLRKDIVQENDPLDYSLRAAKAYCYEVGMHLTPGGIGGKPTATPSAQQISILCECLQSNASLLDSVLATQPFPNQVAYTIADWARVSYAVVVMSKLSLSYIDVVDASGTNVLAYMDALIDRGAQLNVSERKGVTDYEFHDVFFFLKWLFGNMRSWHEMRLARNDDGAGIHLDACGGGCGGAHDQNVSGDHGDDITPLQMLPKHELQIAKEAEQKKQEEAAKEKAMMELEVEVQQVQQQQQQQMPYSADMGYNAGGGGDELFGWMQWLPTLGLISEDSDMWGSIITESLAMETDGNDTQVQV